MTTEIFAHRGLHLTEVENSVPSFLEAKALGVHGVELDVRRTRDGALVVHHDMDIEGVGNIADVDLRDLPAGVATLSDVMNACTGMKVNVEIKNWHEDAGYDPSGSLATQTMELLAHMGWLDDIIVSSFDLDTCVAVKSLAPTVPVGWLLHWQEPALDNARRAHELGLQAVHPHFLTIDEAFVSQCHEWGMAVNVWTVNKEADIRSMLALGVDTIISDDPGLGLSILNESK
jgi:glycerophosphoryl diester phosphodiesterase